MNWKKVISWIEWGIIGALVIFGIINLVWGLI